MTKKTNILIILLLVALALVLYLILTSESVKPTAETVEPTPNESAALLEADYQEKAKPIFVDFEKLAGEDNFTVEKITELKNKLLDLKVPSKFKELHIQLVLAMAKMENYLNQKKLEEKAASRQMINQLKANYSWLNN